MISSTPLPRNQHPSERAFGKREQHPVVTLRHKGRESSVTLKPITTAVSLGFMASVVIGAIIAGAYVSMKDDLVSATLARHARMQHAYEDRITTLRAQVDLVTSRQMLDQQAVENRVEQLMERQATIGARQVRVRAVLNRAAAAKALSNSQSVNKGATEPLPAATVPVPKKGGKSLRLGALMGTTSPFGNDQNNSGKQRVQVAHATPDSVLFEQMEESLQSTEQEQIIELANLKISAEEKYGRLASLLGKYGVPTSEIVNTGGPLIELKSGDHFLDMINALDDSLESLENVRAKARSLPHGSPAPGQRISSGFGTRIDPFTKRRAVHSGLDYKARQGVSVYVTGAGIVSKAKWSGGYGKMIEVDHGNGLKTRYAHLSRMKVNVGQKVQRGQLIGKVGSTGRSTGPHLHYEVRQHGQARNPLKFVKLEKALKPLL